MADLRTRYLGLELQSPLVASSSPLTGSLDGLRRLEAAGAGAVVLPSLFEEELATDQDQVGGDPGVGRAERAGYGAGPAAYHSLVEQAKQTLSIPVIASLNGTSRSGWVRHAARLEQAGADALELNIYYVSSRPGLSGGEVEGNYLDVVREVRRAIGIPLAVKLSPYFSSLANMAGQPVEAGADGRVLFNRFYQPDLDIEALEVLAALDRHPAPAPPGVAGRLDRGPHRHRRAQGAAGRGGRGHDDLGPAAQRPRPPAPDRGPAAGLDGPPRLRDGRPAPRPPQPALGPRPGRLRAGQLRPHPDVLVQPGHGQPRPGHHRRPGRLTGRRCACACSLPTDRRWAGRQASPSWSAAPCATPGSRPTCGRPRRCPASTPTAPWSSAGRCTPAAGTGTHGGSSSATPPLSRSGRSGCSAAGRWTTRRPGRSRRWPRCGPWPGRSGPAAM